MEPDIEKARWGSEKFPHLLAHGFWGEVTGREAPFPPPTQSDEQGLAQSKGPQDILLLIPCLLEAWWGREGPVAKETQAKTKRDPRRDVK